VHALAPYRAYPIIPSSPRYIHRSEVQTGTPPYGSFGGGPDVINLANLNSHITIPVLHKPGRGVDFSYDLSYDSSIWFPTSVGGVQTWTPVINWGWTGQTEVATGYVSFKKTTGDCGSGRGRVSYNIYTFSKYYDQFGTSHSFNNIVVDDSVQKCTSAVGPFSGSTTVIDGSGYKVSVDATPSASVISSVGTQFSPPVGTAAGAGRFTDRNGNKITADGTGKFFDTLSSTVAVLTVSGGGTPTSPITFAYTDSSGNSGTKYSVNYTNFTVATNFGLTGTVEYTSSTAVPLVTSITLPDSSQYAFSYEPTPSIPAAGACSPIPGTVVCVTARLKSVTLPTGGTITYSYAGGNNGILSDGSTATLTRMTLDGTWTYAQVKDTGAASTTTITDPATSANQRLIQFQGVYETQRLIYQGSSSGTLLQTINTCYNGAASPCTTTAIALPIAQRTTLVTVPGPGNLIAQHTDKFDSFGNVIESDEYDFATGAPFPLLRQTLITYAVLGNNLNAFKQIVKVLDGSGNPKSRQDTTYDQYGSGLVCVTSAPNHDDTGHGCSFTSRANATSTTSYTDPVTPSGAITKNFTFDSLGNLRTAQLNCCQLETLAYSAPAYAYPDSLTKGSSSPQLTSTATYDLHMGLVLTSTDPNNVTTTMTYDSMGRPLTVTTGSLPPTNYTYTDSGNWSVKVCSPVQGTQSACQKMILDVLGRTKTTQLLDGSSILYSAVDTQYDSLGRAYKTSNPYTTSASYWTQLAFDVLGRSTSTVFPDNSASSISYSDNTVTDTDPAGKKREAVLDGLGHMKTIYEPDPANGNTLTLQTSYLYNLFDQLTQATQGSQTRTYGYDATGRLLSATTPEAGRVCFGSVTGSTCNTDGYDSFNNLLKRTDARGVLTSYGYDTLNRVTGVAYNVGTSGVTATPSVSLTYGIDSSCNATHGTGCIGQVISMTDGAGSENYTYNNFGQMTQLSKVIGTTTYPLNYTYNLAGELASVTYPSGRVITQNLDNIGRLSSIVGNLNSVNTTYASGFAFSPASQVIGFRYGNNVYASFGYSADRLQLGCLDYSTTNRSSCTHDGTTKFGLSYSFPASPANNGQVAGVTDAVDNGRSAAYIYDSLYRLTSAITTGSTAYPKWGLSETYDRYGNRTAQSTITGQGCTGITCPTNSISVSTTTNRVSSPYAYDASGNMTNDGSNTLAYDAENRTLSATSGSSSGTYTYDGNGLRIKKVSATTTIYIFSGSRVVAEYDNGAAPTAPSREYIYSGSTLLAKIDSSGTKYYHQDALSNRLVSDSSGSTAEQLGHFPFGESWYNASNDKLLFTSYERDSESGNDYAMARSYISRLGRFSSPDPLAGSTSDPQSLNRYTYVGNDPQNLADPSGLGPCSAAKVPSACGGGVIKGGSTLCVVDLVLTLCESISENTTTQQYTYWDSRGFTTYQQDAGGGWTEITPKGTRLDISSGALAEAGLSFDGAIGGGDFAGTNALAPASGAGGGGLTNPCAGKRAPNLLNYWVKQHYNDGSTDAAQHITQEHILPMPDKSIYVVPQASNYGFLAPAITLQAVIAINAATFQNPQKVTDLGKYWGFQRTFLEGQVVGGFKIEGTTGIGNLRAGGLTLTNTFLIYKKDCLTPRTSFPGTRGD
jgi:RHS repeat-associated protein